MGNAPRLGELPATVARVSTECRTCDHALRCWDALNNFENPPHDMTWQRTNDTIQVPWSIFHGTVMLHWRRMFSTADDLAAHLGKCGFSEEQRIAVIEVWREYRMRRLAARTKTALPDGNRGALFAFYLDQMELDGQEITPAVLHKVGDEVYPEKVPAFVIACARMMERAKGGRAAGQEASAELLRAMGVGKADPGREARRAESLRADEERDRFP